MGRPPERTSSYWVDTEPPEDLDGRDLPAETDVAVLGAGIAGLTTAYLLTKAGRSVVVVDAGRVAAGVSGHTTAKVTSQHNLIYADLVKNVGREHAALYGRSQEAAIAWIAARVDELKVDCDLRRRPSYVYAEDPSYGDRLKAEADTAADLGLPAELVADIGLGFPTAGAVKFRDQAQFHPRRWLLALARAIVDGGGRIVEGVRAQGLSVTGRPTVHTTAGDLRARDVVVATHYPVFDRGLYFARLEPKRSLLLAAPVRPDQAPPGMYISADTGHSIRTTPAENGQETLLLGGEGYHPGEDDDVEARFARLAEWGGARLGIHDYSHRWATQDNKSMDRVPYIGRYHPLARHLWVAAGFGLWGMTNGTVAGLLLTDLITGADNPWQPVYDPARLTIRATAPGVIKLGLRTAAHLGADYARAYAPGNGATDLEPGEGTVVRSGGRPVAVHRAADGTTTSVSAICTHLGCLVAFNDAEQTWDCPCHGSRFAPDGSVLHGPATRPLKPLDRGAEGTAAATDRAGD